MIRFGCFHPGGSHHVSGGHSNKAVREITTTQHQSQAQREIFFNFIVNPCHKVTFLGLYKGKKSMVEWCA